MLKKLGVIFISAAIILQTECLCVKESDTVRLPVLMYHQISPNPNSWNDYVISPEQFRDDMEYLKNLGWESISINELLAWQRGDFEMPEKPVMITFDDGFKSLLEYAEPILKEFDYKAVVAIIGAVCEKYSADNEYPGEWDYMSWTDLMELTERGTVEVQCHSWDLHSNRNNLGCGKKRGEGVPAYRRRLSEDLSKFITEMEKNNIDFCYTIAYPYGTFDSNTLEIVKDMGFIAAFTCTEEINILTGDSEELYYLGRFNRPHGISSKKYFENIEKSVDIE